jgi:hypothetical protein
MGNGGLSVQRVFRSLACVIVWVAAATPSFAQQARPSEAGATRAELDHLRVEFDALRQQYESQLAALTARLAALESAASSVPAVAQTSQAGGSPRDVPTPPAPEMVEVSAGAADAGGPQGALPVYGATAGSKILNPDIAVIGDFLGAAGRNRVSPSRALEMHESEASLQAIVDPYSRADFFIAFGEEGVDLEEGFVTFPAVPGGLLVKAGKMRASFGKVNGLHNHVLPWTDRPIVTGNLLGGEEGISAAGFSVARLIPNPWLFLEATGQVFRGDAGDELFRSSQSGDVAYVGRLRAYHDLSESTNMDLGLSYSRGHNPAGIVNDTDVGRFTTQLYGLDATVRWRPLRRSIYHSFAGRTELIWSRREQFDGPQHAMGYFISGDYQVARRWFAGMRYDRSQHADDPLRLDRGESVVLTYWPSEFSQVRSQYRRTAYAVGPTANELLFQIQFSIGAHGAHPF